MPEKSTTASSEESLTAPSPGRGRIDDGFTMVAITQHPAQSLQQLGFDLQHQRDDTERMP
jgi:hypothetical protein